MLNEAFRNPSSGPRITCRLSITCAKVADELLQWRKRRLVIFRRSFIKHSVCVIRTSKCPLRILFAKWLRLAAKVRGTQSHAIWRGEHSTNRFVTHCTANPLLYVTKLALWWADQLFLWKGVSEEVSCSFIKLFPFDMDFLSLKRWARIDSDKHCSNW